MGLALRLVRTADSGRLRYQRRRTLRPLRTNADAARGNRPGRVPVWIRPRMLANHSGGTIMLTTTARTKQRAGLFGSAQIGIPAGTEFGVELFCNTSLKLWKVIDGP